MKIIIYNIDNDLSGYANSLVDRFKFDNKFTRIGTETMYIHSNNKLKRGPLACAMSICNFIKYAMN